MKAIKRILSRRDGRATSMEIVNRLRSHQLRIVRWGNGTSITVQGMPDDIEAFKHKTGGWKKKPRKAVPA